jgi:hypothetical protein
MATISTSMDTSMEMVTTAMEMVMVTHEDTVLLGDRNRPKLDKSFILSYLSDQCV